ncbi:DUF302 domain-containing protein [Mycobacteroides salmoniphilum]|uniref:DUF302 domain-containing protein n=1 Tax=Mycobacteroides salmoniphilum TaxID=404941 RepID=A0A4R8SDJ2_9MYCO|nr:DUF302 domain-containing protein [Mycobacteroides salmoniphilum]TDZ93476.1 hypothetical protein CCUG60885_03079 [Mycobacteroides salmoniphilum]TEA09259.1 hypothetical protein CCUG60883_00020 [Mycobacteroides salmoniphilum]
MSDSGVRTASHIMTRIDISTAIPFDDFRSRLEHAAPAFDAEPFQRIIETGGSWSDVQSAVERMAPHQLMRYATIEATAIMSLAGHTTKAVEYLLGNHVIAESMFRHDPRALLYAPLRVLLFSDTEGDAVFSLDQPSTAFGSLGIGEVTWVGLGLDDKVAALLRFLGVDASFPQPA